MGRGELITNKLKELTNSQDASVLAELAPGGIETIIECIRNLEPGGRVALIAPNPEPLNFAAALLAGTALVTEHGDHAPKSAPPISPRTYPSSSAVENEAAASGVRNLAGSTSLDT